MKKLLIASLIASGLISAVNASAPVQKTDTTATMKEATAENHKEDDSKDHSSAKMTKEEKITKDLDKAEKEYNDIKEKLNSLPEEHKKCIQLELDHAKLELDHAKTADHTCAKKNLHKVTQYLAKANKALKKAEKKHK